MSISPQSAGEPVPAIGRGLDRLAYDTDQLREQTGIGKTKIFEAIDSGALEARYLGRKLVFQHADVMAWLNSLPKRPPGPSQRRRRLPKHRDQAA